MMAIYKYVLLLQSRQVIFLLKNRIWKKNTVACKSSSAPNGLLDK